MTATHDHTDQPDQRQVGPAPAAGRRRRPNGQSWAGIAAGVACLACLLPLLAAGGFAAGLGALLTDVDLVAVVLLAVGGIAASIWISRRRRRTRGKAANSCGCAGCGAGC